MSRQSPHEDGKVVSPTDRPPLPATRYLWYSFPLGAESTGYLSASSAVRQPTTPRTSSSGSSSNSSNSSSSSSSSFCLFGACYKFDNNWFKVAVNNCTQFSQTG